MGPEGQIVGSAATASASRLAGMAGSKSVMVAVRTTSIAVRPSERQACCARLHRAVELVGKRWTGAILSVLMDGPLRFSEVRQLVPDLSDRLLSERMKELEAEGIVERRAAEGGSMHSQYALTPKGRALEPALRALKEWAHTWL